MLSRLAALLSQYPDIQLALLFGSQATGTARADSDIDLGILMSVPLSADFKLQLMENIGAEFGRPVDIVDLYHVPEPITGQAFKGKRIIGDDTTYANLLYRHLLNVADFLPLHQRILTERRNRWIK
ncbi:nucleotidyltransferase domain-containing protein [Nitrosomonas sp. JL21]|uniref:type VII toxin-antitoxin system MntA family adenylyltransferase antitoxin n=1 Tax=Nitrosomonas sp. JL21 TaxID=153949 RepID=UPI001367B376|nr:nucleotidyltransferase domain-containing protein [Nitrosomonas sp.]MCC7091942.1 nucleotidyltransferase domain-containing protein [Nitrosomonas sp.]MXS78214.1 nucleotidyltransferase domain-containing protein [Nitrosomonas sp. JL21]